MSPTKLKVGTHVNNGWMYLVYRKQAAAAAYLSFFHFFFLSNFQRLKFFITFFLGTMRPRYSKLVTHEDCEWMYKVYRNQAAAAAYSSLYFFIFLFSPVFKH